MEGSKVALEKVMVVVLSLCGVVRLCCAQEIPVACMMSYDEGGAPAVFSSQECPQWEWTHPLHVPQNHPTANCEFASAILQGRKSFQEDRISCNPAMKIPLIGKDELKEITVGIAAVFDGHVGAEASDLASKKFLDYFYLNAVFNTYKQAFSHKKENDQENHGTVTIESSDSTSSSLIDDAFLYDNLKEALIRTFRDIDSEFTQEALMNNYASGSTGTVSLLVNGQVLVGFVGDSKALLCSDKRRASQDAKGTSGKAPYVQELTIDHHPAREDERARIEATGNFAGTWRAPDMLAMTRAIGDLSLRRFGVISEPEVIGWQNLTSDNSFLVLGSDGIFEGLTPANVCAILNNNACKPGTTTSSSSSSCLAASELANNVVNSAFENGSSDNLSIIVIPLESAYSSQ